MPEFSVIWAFIVAVIWGQLVVVLLSLGVPPIMQHGYEKLFGRPLPVKLGWILLAGLLIAVFLAWKDEYEKRLELQLEEAEFNVAETRVKTLKDDLDKSEKRAIDLTITVNELRRDKTELQQKLTGQEKDFISQLAALRQSNLEKQQRLDEKERRKIIRERLGKFITEGGQLKLRCVQDSILPQSDYKKWINQIEKFFALHMDHSFIDEFHSGTTAMGPMKAPTEAHMQLWRDIHVRVENLKVIKGHVSL